MTRELICPYCRFSKAISREKIPEGAKRVLCPQCGQRFDLSISEASPRPAIDGAAADNGFERPGEEPRESNSRDGAPWEKRDRVGLWQGTWQTLKGVLFSPEKLFTALTFTDGIKEPLAFGLLVGSIGSMFTLFWQFLMFSGGISAFDLSVSDRFPIGLIFAVLLVLVPIFVTAGIFFYTTALHLLLLIVRGGGNGYEATFRVVSYSQATQVLGLVPVIGSWIGGVWQVVVQIIGLREIHDTSYLRVILAFLIPVAFLFVLAIAVMVPLFMYLFGETTV